MQIPLPLINSLIPLKDFHQESFEQVHALQEQVTSIRLNPLKKSIVNSEWSMVKDSSKVEKRLLSSDSQLLAPDSRLPALTPVPWSTNGFYLNKRPSFTFDPFFHAGCYYVQEASSMFLEEAFRQIVDMMADVRVLDLCAAPGGKSTLLQSLITPGSLLVSNEVIKSRVSVLEENLTKWGGANVVITNNDPKDFARLENFFDVIVIDAPCSGSGLFRRDPGSIEEWSEQNVLHCSQRQQRIIADVWPALKKNGVMIYSTCSYSKEENEDILDWIIKELEAGSLPLTVKPEWNITETISFGHSANGYRFWPDKIKGEGFFIAGICKTNGSEDPPKISKKQKLEVLNKSEEAIVRPWLRKDLVVKLLKQGDSILALPGTMDKDLQAIMEASLYIRLAGVRIGKIAGKDLVPDHALALSNLISGELVAISLNHEQAIQYLRREEVPLSRISQKNEEVGISSTDNKDIKPGWTLVKYEGVAIGWIKILQNRINNYYPKEWRILKR